MSAIEEMKKKRFQLLHRLYELTGGDELEWLNLYDIGEELGFDRELTKNIVQYLEREGLIKVIGDQGGIAGISHWGVREVEEALSNPNISGEGGYEELKDVIQSKGSDIRGLHVVFVVHGRNLKARDAMFAFLRSIGLKPLEWSKAVSATSEGSPYIGKILDMAFSCAQAVVVLMTPDDEARLREPFRTPGDPLHETRLTPQARLNVIFEAGMAMGRFPDRTILVELGVLRPFSDIGGRHVIRLDNTAERRHELAYRLEDAGCPVDLSGIDWYKAGDFEIDIEEEQTAHTLEDEFRFGLDSWTPGALIQKIDFDYLPDSPLRNGWALEDTLPEFTLADYFGEKALAIQQVGGYALDRNVHPVAKRGKFVEFVAKYKSGAAVYAHIDVQSKDQSKSERVWIQVQVGTSDPKPHPGGDEWALYVTPTELEGNWQLFRINLIDAVNQTFGSVDKRFEQLIGFRLRGNLELAYISVFNS